MDRTKLIATIPRSGTDEQLRSRGFDLYEEYAEIISRAGFDPAFPVLELAAGPGRASSVLSRLGYPVIAGDLSLAKHADLLKRVTPKYAGAVTVCQLDMERLPIRDRSARSVLSLNTIHELSDPGACVLELVRIHDPEGVFVLSDFTKRGFETMDEVHMAIHGQKHFHGPVGLASLVPIIRQRYRTVERFETALNAVYIFRDKRPRV